jgi:hypothetical protein
MEKPNIRECKIADIQQGKDNRSHITYAKLYDSQNNLLIAATLDYIIERVKNWDKE